LSPVRAQRSTARSSPANGPTLWGPAWHSRPTPSAALRYWIMARQRYCRRLAYLETPCASLPTRSPSQPRTAARKAGVLDPRKQLRERDGLSAGGKWIRTIGPPPEIVVDPSGSRRDHRAKCGCLSARPRVRCLCLQGRLSTSSQSQCSTAPGLIAGTWHRPLFLTRDRWFESGSLQRGVRREPDLQGRIPSMTAGDFANANPSPL